jgi:hypothetical protein
MPLEDFVIAADIARRLKVSSERVRQWRESEEFPQPVGKLGRSLVWRWRDVQRWARKTGRLQ